MHKASLIDLEMPSQTYFLSYSEMLFMQFYGALLYSIMTFISLWENIFFPFFPFFIPAVFGSDNHS